MHGRRFEQILTGTALALVLGLGVDGARSPRRARSRPRTRPRSKRRFRFPSPPTCRRRPSPTSPRQPRSPARPRSSCPIRPTFRRRTFKDVAAPAPAATPAPAAPAPAAAAPVTPAPPAAVVHADQPIRDALREFIGSNRLARVIDKKSERTAVEAFYASRDYAPMFVAPMARPSAAKQTITHLRNADADGMDPNDYPVPSIQAGSGAGRDGGSRDAAGRVGARLCAPRADGPRALFARQRGHLLRADRARPARRAEQVAASNTVADVLNSYQPPQAAYIKLARAARSPMCSTAISRRRPPTRRCARSSPKCAAARATRPRQSHAGRCSSLSTDKRTKQTVPDVG